LKPECWGSLLVQEKYKEEMPVTEISISCNNNNNNNNNMGKLNHLILNTFEKCQGSMVSRNCRKRPYWTLQTYFGKQ
jgi:hypothetical protein